MAHFDARDLTFQVDRTQLKKLYKIQPYKHVMALVYNWLIIGITIFLSIRFFNPFTYVLAVLIIGARMHALAILMHDATHYRFLKNKKWNDLITNFVSMYPLFSSIEAYRQNHLRHHQHLNTTDDPDWFAKLGKKAFEFPKSRTEFFLMVISYFSLFQGIKDAFWLFKRFQAPMKKKNISFKARLPRLVFYALLILGLSLLGLWKYFALYWLIPYFSTLFMFQYIRSVAEHFGELSYDHLLTSTRTTKVNALESFLLAPHYVGYHLEHHLYPGVPFYNLPKLHQLLMEASEYQTKAHITQGYVVGLMNELGKPGVHPQASATSG